jgi:hypothetical protein
MQINLLFLGAARMQKHANLGHSSAGRALLRARQ